MSKRIIISAVVILAAIGVTVFAYRDQIRNSLELSAKTKQRASLPVAEPYSPPKNSPSPAPKNVNAPTNKNAQPSANANGNTNHAIKAALNLAIPFVSQAPFKVWDAFHEDACEEAAMLMVDRYFTGRGAGTLQAQDDELHAMVNWETSTHGYGLSITAEEAATVIRGFYGYKTVELKVDPTIDDMKAYLNQKLPIIVPADGKKLENPNFRGGGPVYHFLVVKGYTADGKWITNDPGTRLGADFTYRIQNVMDSMHDWNGGDVPHGRKVIIIVHPN